MGKAKKQKAEENVTRKLRRAEEYATHLLKEIDLAHEANAEQYAIGFVHGLNAAAGLKTIVDVRKLAKQGQEALKKSNIKVTVEDDQKVVEIPATG